MKNFLRLCLYEQKKLFQKGYVRIALLTMAAVTIFLNIRPLFQKNTIAFLDDAGNVVIKEASYWEEVQMERKFAKQYNGKPLTNEIVCSARTLNQSYAEQLRSGDGENLLLRNVRLPYQSMMNLGINPGADLEYPADFAYQHMTDNPKESFQERFTGDEQEYWLQKRGELSTPLTMYYAKGYYYILDKAYWLNVMALCFTALCLCRAFSDEIAHRTEPLIRASKAGAVRLSAAKLAAGVCISCMAVLLMFGVTAVIQFAIHGIGGAAAPIQLQAPLDNIIMTERSGPLTVGGAVLIVLMVSLLMALFVGAVTMFLSRLFQRAIPALAVPVCVMLLSLMISYPAKDRFVQQIFSYFPFQRLVVGEFLTDGRLVMLFGRPFTAIQMSIILYGGLSILLLCFCMIFCRITKMNHQ